MPSMCSSTVWTVALLASGVVAVDWKGNNWALRCDFRNKDLSNARSSGAECGGMCARTTDCTHFTWSDYNGGTCWMKKGPVSKADAFDVPQWTSCGVMDKGVPEKGPENGEGGPQKTGVLTTFHGAHESGACQLPEGDYTTGHSVALGDVAALGGLKYRNGLCGHVLRVDCGRGAVDIIVNNANLGGGLDLYKSAWNQATGNASPGQRWCSVRMTGGNMLRSSAPRCYYDPDSEHHNRWFQLLGLFNTGARVVKSATLDGRSGRWNGVTPYFAFNGGPVSDGARVTFRFEDGSEHSVTLRDCQRQKKLHLWG